MNDVEVPIGPTKTPKQIADEYINRVIGERRFGKGELPPDVNTFFSLPIEEPKMAAFIANCAAGIAITRDRLWLVHLAFIGEDGGDELWPDWDELEQEPPKHLYSFGQNERRLEKLETVLEEKTGVKAERKLITPKNTGIFQLGISQDGDTLNCVFEEVGLPSNNILTHTEIKPNMV